MWCGLDSDYISPSSLHLLCSLARMAVVMTCTITHPEDRSQLLPLMLFLLFGSKTMQWPMPLTSGPPCCHGSAPQNPNILEVSKFGKANLEQWEMRSISYLLSSSSSWLFQRCSSYIKSLWRRPASLNS